MGLLDIEGFTVGVTADRRRSEQVALLEARGARVLVGPSIRLLPLGSEGRLRLATERLLAEPPEVFIATTGIGVRGWLAAAGSWGLERAVVCMLSRTRLEARGPKATGALMTAGLAVTCEEPSETMAGLIDRLTIESLSGTTVALQLDGGEASEAVERLSGAGARVVTLPVYRWALPEDTSAAERLIHAACELRLDAVTFTSAPALRNLISIAEREQLADTLRRALNGPVVTACQGPVCAAAARQVDIGHPLVPHRSRLGTLVRDLAVELAGRRSAVRLAGVDVVVQGRAVVFGDEQVTLSDRERALFEVLLRRHGAVVGRQTLLREVWGLDRPEARVVDATVNRLRHRLGRAGAAVVAVPRRGYRIAMDEVRAT